MTRLRGKVALVTGAGAPNSMGGAIALELAKEGADIAVTNVNSGSVDTEKLQEAIVAEGVRCFVNYADVRQVADCQRLVDETVAHYGKLDVLVNCAGVALIQNFLDIKEEDYDLLMDVNLKGTFFMSQAAIRHMLPRKAGRIVNIGSEMAYLGEPTGCHYAASKAGIRALSKSMALAAAPYITVNTVAPGPTDTDAFMNFEERTEENREKLPLQRFGTPSNVGRSVVFLATSDGDCYTGQTLDPNCGAVLV